MRRLVSREQADFWPICGGEGGVQLPTRHELDLTATPHPETSEEGCTNIGLRVKTELTVPPSSRYGCAFQPHLLTPWRKAIRPLPPLSEVPGTAHAGLYQ